MMCASSQAFHPRHRRGHLDHVGCQPWLVSWLVSEIGVRQLLRLQPLRRASQRHPPLQQAIDPLGGRERALDVLLDQHDRGALAADVGERAIDLLDHDGSKPERYLVAQQEPRIRHQRATDRRHLLLAAGELTRKHPPPLVDGRRFRIRYVTQVKARPPTFSLFTSSGGQLPSAYERYLVNGLRDTFGLHGVPIRIMLRKSKNPFASEDERRR